MIYAFVRLSRSFSLSMEKLAMADALIVSPLVVSSKKQLLLALYLAKRAFEDKTNVARDFRLEFLLWLSAKTDIKSAVSTSQPKGKEALLVIFSGTKKKILEKLHAEEIKEKKLGSEIDPIALEKISLGRIF